MSIISFEKNNVPRPDWVCEPSCWRGPFCITSTHFTVMDLNPDQPERETGWDHWCYLCSHECWVCLSALIYAVGHLCMYACCIRVSVCMCLLRVHTYLCYLLGSAGLGPWQPLLYQATRFGNPLTLHTPSLLQHCSQSDWSVIWPAHSWLQQNIF